MARGAGLGRELVGRGESRKGARGVHPQHRLGTSSWSQNQTQRQGTYNRPLFLQDQAASLLERLES